MTELMGYRVLIWSMLVFEILAPGARTDLQKSRLASRRWMPYLWLAGDQMYLAVGRWKRRNVSKVPSLSSRLCCSTGR
jgi:hypothetical protein